MTKYVTLDDDGFINGMYLDDPGEGIELSDEDWSSVGPGYKYLKGKLVAPAEKTEQQIKEEEDLNKKAANYSTKSSLMQESTDKISVLQDSVDLDMATDEEKESLVAWKKYRVLLNRVSADTASQIEWPNKPD